MRSGVRSPSAPLGKSRAYGNVSPFSLVPWDTLGTLHDNTSPYPPITTHTHTHCRCPAWNTPTPEERHADYASVPRLSLREASLDILFPKPTQRTWHGNN